MITVDRGGLSLADLSKTPITDPPRGPGKLWQGVQHGAVVNALLTKMGDRQFTHAHRNVRCWTSANGGDAAAAFPVDRPTIKGWAPWLGLFMSNRQTEILTVFCGAVRTDGGHAVVTAGMSRFKDARWMYTTHFDLKYVVEETWEWWDLHLPDVPGHMRRMADADCPEPRVNHLLMAVGRREVLPWSRVGAADRRFRKDGGKTLLDLHRAVGTALAQANPIHQLKAGYRLTSMLTHAAAKKKEKV